MTEESSESTHTIKVNVEGLMLSKLKQTLSSKRFQALTLAVLCAVGAFASGSIDVAEMWSQIRVDLGLYITSVLVVQVPVETAEAFRGISKS